jgi:hypothetical protein
MDEMLSLGLQNLLSPMVVLDVIRDRIGFVAISDVFVVRPERF